MTESQKTVVFGIHAVESIIQSSADSVDLLIIERGKNNQRIQSILKLANSSGVLIEYKARGYLDATSGFGNHQGVLTLVKQNLSSKSSVNFDDFIQQACDSSIILILDQIQDPHNLGACLRTAESVGVSAVILPKDRSC